MATLNGVRERKRLDVALTLYPQHVWLHPSPPVATPQATEVFYLPTDGQKFTQRAAEGNHKTSGFGKSLLFFVFSLINGSLISLVLLPGTHPLTR
jgi:hypothetical protein